MKKKTLQDVKKNDTVKAVKQYLKLCQANNLTPRKTQLADMLGISKQTLNYRLKTYGIEFKEQN